MLILIAGATGNLGGELTRSALARGHQVRALGRDPSKLPAELAAKIESFVTSKTYYDVPALEAAVKGVDAIICAYTGLPELLLDGQLLLIRAAERAGVTKYVAASWNYDWRKIPLGHMQTYDPFICLNRHTELTCKIKPIFIFTGVLTEVFFSFPGAGHFSPENHGVWDPDRKVAETYGTGNELWHFTSYADAAEYTVEIVQLPEADQGGFYSVSSDVMTLRELCALYGRVRGVEAPLTIKGTVDELSDEAYAYQKTLKPDEWWKGIGYFYHLFTLQGIWMLGELDNHKLKDAKTKGMEQWLRANPNV